MILTGLTLAGTTHAATLYKLETADFTVLSDASKRDVEKFATGYAAYRKTYADLLLPTGRRLPPARIILFRRQGDFEDLMDNGNHRKNTRLGSYSGDLDYGVLIAIPVDGNREHALRLIYEFDTIWGLRRSGFSLPLWASQGTGEVLSSLEWNQNRIKVGVAPPNFTDTMRGGRLIPWSRFLDINAASPEYNDSIRDGRFHAQAWLIMHWVLFGGDSWSDARPRFESFTHAMAENSSDIAAIEQAFGLTADQFEDAVTRHRRSTPKPFDIAFDEKTFLAEAQLGSATETEWFVELSNLAVMSKHEWEAYDYLEKARTMDPQSVAVLEALGRRELREGRDDAAADFFHDAIDAGSTNPKTYVRSAQRRLERAGFTHRLSPGGMSAIFARPARNEIERALELYPDSDEAWLLLARILIVSKDTAPEEVTLLDDAITRQTRGEHLRYLRALLRERFEDVAGARDDLRRVVSDPRNSPSLHENARDVLFRSAIKDTAALVQEKAMAKDFAGAQQTLDDARTAIAGVVDEIDPQDNLGRLQAWLDKAQSLALNGGDGP